MLRIGVIGYGYWGPNLVRNFYESPTSTVTWVSDLHEKRLDLVRSRYPGVRVTPDHAELIEAPDVDAVALATPVATHHRLAMAALGAGKHVFVEKPISETAEQAREMIAEAERRNRILMVDHTFIYTGAVRKMRELIDAGELGDLYYYDSVRVNLGLFQPDVSVVWDLAVHDLSIMQYLFSDRPTAVSATGMSHVPGRPVNIAYITVFFDSSLIAHIHVNWLSPVKLRHTLIGGSRKMLLYDDLEPSEKIKLYDKGIVVDEREQIYQTLIGYRTGDMWAPKLDSVEALQAEAREFAACVEAGRSPANDGRAGLTVVQILEAATESIGRGGAPVSLES